MKFKQGKIGYAQPLSEVSSKPTKSNTGLPEFAKLGKYIETKLAKMELFEVETPSRYDLRASGLPLCPLLKILHDIHPIPQREKYSDKFFTTIGTSVHENIQNYLQITNKNTVAAWSCKACKHIHSEPQICPKKCVKCGHEKLSMEEITLDINGVSGHLDYLIKVKNKYVGLEFKTTTSFGIKSGNGLPKPKHHIQIQSYCLALKKKYGFNMLGYIIIYLSRDLPFGGRNNSFRVYPYKITREMLRNRNRRINKTVAGWHAATSLKPAEFNVASVKKVYYDHRPCVSANDYEDPNEGMHLSFYKTQCEFITSKGCCWKTYKQEVDRRKMLASQPPF